MRMIHIISNKNSRQNEMLFCAIGQCRRAVLFTLIVVFACSQIASASNDKSYISTEQGKGTFTLSASGKSVPLYASSQDYPGVLRVLKHLQKDLTNVTGAQPDLSIDTMPASKEIVLIGTLGRSPVIDKL